MTGEVPLFQIFINDLQLEMRSDGTASRPEERHSHEAAMSRAVTLQCDSEVHHGEGLGSPPASQTPRQK